MTERAPDLFDELRRKALSFVDPEAPAGDLYGVIIDFGLSTGLATLVALGDGTVSLYFSNGSAFLGAGEYDFVARVALRLATTAMRFVDVIGESRDFSPAKAEETKFFILIGGAIRGEAIPTRALQAGHALAPLYRDGHALLTEVRQVYPNG